MHPIIGLLVLISLAAFVAFAFRRGMGVPRSGRNDYGEAASGGPDSGPGHSADGGFSHGIQNSPALP